MDGVNLEKSKEKNEVMLGVCIQSDLKWSEQISSLVGKLKKRLSGLDHLRLIMGKATKKTIVEGVFNSVMCYCLPLFGGCNITEVQALQVQQSRAARIILNLPPRTNRELMISQLGWLTVYQLIAYHTLLTVFRIMKCKKPEYLYKALGRDNRNGHIIVENSRLGLYNKSFIPRGSTLWNRLPVFLKKIEKVGRFKKEMRKWVADNVRNFID